MKITDKMRINFVQKNKVSVRVFGDEWVANAPTTNAFGDPCRCFYIGESWRKAVDTAMMESK